VHIADIEVFRIRGERDRPAFPTGDRQARALDLYPEASPPGRPHRAGGKEEASGIYVEIRTDEAVSGLFGPIEKAQAFVIQTYLRPFLVGRDPLATEALLDQMLRLDRHGRSGLFVTGISSVDCALWDLKGKAWGEPVYRLLGGPTRTAVPAYASMLGFSVEPRAAAETAGEFRSKGFTAQKWFFRYGPAEGELGKVKNLAMAQAVREAVGAEYPLMFDAFMGWDLAYAVEMVKGLAPVRPRWMEEPVPPERVGELQRIRAASSVPVATGEHVYTRWQAKELLVREAVDVLQTDPDWTGGVSELTKVCVLGSAFGVPVVAHGHSLLPALHVAAAQSPSTVPWVEYLILHQESKQWFHTPMYEPAQGDIRLPDLPGLGLVLDEGKISGRELLQYG